MPIPCALRPYPCPFLVLCGRLHAGPSSPADVCMPGPLSFAAVCMTGPEAPRRFCALCLQRPFARAACRPPPRLEPRPAHVCKNMQSRTCSQRYACSPRLSAAPCA
eukprot:4681387-Prymnesium_polylepis.1